MSLLWPHFVFGVLIGTPVSVSINLLLYSPAWSQRERLEELWLTPISSREAAFGSVFWSVLTGMLLPVSTLFALFACFIFDFREWFMSVSRGGVFACAFIVLLVCSALSAACITVNHWFNLQRQRWRVLFLGVVTTFAVGIWFLIGGIFLGVWIDDVITYRDEIVFCLVLMLMGPLAVLGTARVAGTLVPTKFWSPLFPEPAEELLLPNSARALRRNRPLRKRARQNLGRWAPVSLFRQTVVLCTVTIILAGISLLLTRSHPQYNSPSFSGSLRTYLAPVWNPYFLTILLSLIMTALAVVERLCRGLPFPVVVPGRLLSSFFRKHSLAFTAYVGAFTLGGVYSILGDYTSSSERWVLSITGSGILMLAIMLASILLGLHAFILSRSTWILWLAAWNLILLVSFSSYALGPRMAEFFWYNPRNDESFLLFFLGPLWIAGSLAVLSPQALHTRSVAVLRAAGYRVSPGSIEPATPLESPGAASGISTTKEVTQAEHSQSANN